MAQFARPASTISSGGWTFSDLSLHEDTDEVTPNGTDYAEADSTDTTMELKLSSVTDPASSTGHTVRVYAQVTGGSGAPEKLDIALYQGSTLIVTATPTINRGAYALRSLTLSAAEADSITDYSDLRLRFTVNSLAAGETIQVTQCEFEVPDAAALFDASVSCAVTLSAALTTAVTMAANVAASCTASTALVTSILLGSTATAEATASGNLNSIKLFNVVKRTGLFQVAKGETAQFCVTRSGSALFTRTGKKEVWF